MTENEPATLIPLPPCRVHLTAPISDPHHQSTSAGLEAPVKPSSDITAALLTSVAKKLCIGDEGYPELTGDHAVVTEVTNELVYDARTAVYELYSTKRSSVRWIDQTKQLDQEEALAYVLAYLFGRVVLPTEARNLGELARHAAITVVGSTAAEASSKW